MAESLVNPQHTAALSVRNQEPTHLKAGSYETIGGPSVSSEPGGADYKIDGAKGVGTDTSIPKAVGSEPSHLKTEDAPADADVAFDDEDMMDEDDDLDAELDKFESVDDMEVDVDLDEEDDKDDDDKDKVNEDENPFAKKDDDKDEKDEVKEEDESDDDKDKVNEDENPFAKKDDDKDEKDEVKEEDDKDADEKEKVDESVKVRIKLPKLALTESVVPARNQKKVAALFEQAIRNTTRQVTKQVAAHYRKLHESKLAKRDAVLTKQIDNYLGYVVEEWLRQNKVAVRQSLRVQMTEQFLTGLQSLFKEHYVDVPESKIDLVAKLQKQNARLKGSLNEQHAKTMKVRKLAEAANKARIVAQFSRTLSESEASKLQKLAEDVSYKTAKDFREKLSLLRESYFPKTKSEKKPIVQNLTEAVTVTVEGSVEKPVTGSKEIDADVAEIVNALTRQANASKW